jgi:small subunit ribosomal protein S6
MRTYEIVYIVKPDVSEEDLDKLISQMESLITNNGGAIQKTEKWGRRRLAYQVRRQREGQYVITTTDCEPPALREFERVLKVSEPVIKFQTVRIDEELKRLEKLRRRREKRGASKGAAAPSAPGPPTHPAPPAPSAPPAPPAPEQPNAT